MTEIVFIGCYVLNILAILYYFTCTERKDIPLLLEIVVALIFLIPGIHMLGIPMYVVITYFLEKYHKIIKKDNWINRTLM